MSESNVAPCSNPTQSPETPTESGTHAIQRRPSYSPVAREGEAIMAEVVPPEFDAAAEAAYRALAHRRSLQHVLAIVVKAASKIPGGVL